MPVLPDVASITVCPGFSAPRRSASVDDGEGQPVLHRTAGIEGLDLHVHLHVLRCHAVQPHHRAYGRWFPGCCGRSSSSSCCSFLECRSRIVGPVVRRGVIPACQLNQSTAAARPPRRHTGWPVTSHTGAGDRQRCQPACRLMQPLLGGRAGHHHRRRCVRCPAVPEGRQSRRRGGGRSCKPPGSGRVRPARPSPALVSPPVAGQVAR